LKKSIQVMKMPYAEILDEEQPWNLGDNRDSSVT
jgi:hypothetical protein